MDNSILTGWFIHWTFDGLWILGAILLIAWAIKNLKPQKLKMVALTLFVVGMIGSFMTMSASLKGWQMFMEGGMKMM